MSRHLRPIRLTLAALVVLSAVAATAHQQPINPDAKLLQDFQQRIDDYMALHEKVAKGAAELRPTKSPEAIKAAQENLAARIRAERSAAKQGDIFTPEIARHIRRLLRPELKGPDAAETKKAIKDDSPPGVPLKVNGPYTADALPTVPPNVLLRLPRLPEDLEYRIVGKDLILRDVDANLIVDFIPGAIP
ncbi:MAG TPA: hypothetical protein VD833_09565 [Vicinamibacterales bacterium]|nr:hypothetical protein [Vicinamibacterales bacterium]